MSKEERIKKVVSACEKYGCTVDSRIVDAKHTDAFWYDGTVVTLRLGEYQARLCAEGYIVLDVEGQTIRKPIGSSPLAEDEVAKKVVVDDDGLLNLLAGGKAKFKYQNRIYLKILSPQGYVTQHNPVDCDDFVEAMEMTLSECAERFYTLSAKSPTVFNQRMRQIFETYKDDKEESHKAADNLMIETLTAINEGFREGCEFFKNQHCWYS